MKIGQLFLILLIGAVIYGVIRRDELLVSLQAKNRHFISSNRGSGKTPADVPMAVTKIAAERGISIDLANEQFNNAIANTRRFRLQGRAVERLPFGHVLVRGDAWDQGQIMTANGLFALYGYPQPDTLTENVPVTCTVWLVGFQRLSRKDGKMMSFEEAIYTPDAPTSEGKGEWMKNKERTLLDKKAP